MPNPVVHFEIGCPDLEKSREFFRAVFGWEGEACGPYSASLPTGVDRGIEGFTTCLGHEPHQYVLVYIEVDDVTATLETITAHGGETMIPATKAPAGTFAWFKDPSGNMLGLWKPDEDA